MFRLLVLLLLAPCLAVALMTAPAPAQAQVTVDQTYAAPSGSAYTVTGRGYGHGTGMSQFGARGAARQGLSHQQITDFYYPGTTMGRATGSGTAGCCGWCSRARAAR